VFLVGDAGLLGVLVESFRPDALFDSPWPSVVVVALDVADAGLVVRVAEWVADDLVHVLGERL